MMEMKKAGGVVLAGLVLAGLSVRPVQAAGKIIFADDFEMPSMVSPNAYPNTDGACDPDDSAPDGTKWFVGGADGVNHLIQVTSYPKPGPASGKNYLRFSNWEDHTRAIAAKFGAAVRQTLRIEFNLCVPFYTHAPVQLAEGSVIIRLNNGTPAETPALELSLAQVDDGAGHITYNITNHNGKTWVDSGIAYLPNVWQKWTIELDFNQPNYRLTVGQSSITLPRTGAPQASELQFTMNRCHEENKTGNHHEAYLDDLTITAVSK